MFLFIRMVRVFEWKLHLQNITFFPPVEQDAECGWETAILDSFYLHSVSFFIFIIYSLHLTTLLLQGKKLLFKWFLS